MTLIFLFQYIYALLSTFSHVLSPDVISQIRRYVSSLSLMALRSVLLKLMEFLTNLGSLDTRYLTAGTPSLLLLQTAVIDLVYGSSRRRPGIVHFSFLYYSF